MDSSTARSPLVKSSVVALACVLGALLTAACQSAPDAPPPVPADTWAVVQGVEIKRDAVEKAFRRLANGTAAMSNEEALGTKLGLLEDLIVEEILLARARELKLEVAETEVDTAYATARGNMTDDAFQQELTKRNLTTADIRDSLRRELLAQKVLERDVTMKVAVADQEVTDFFNANRPQFNLAEDAYHLAQIVVTPAAEPQVANRTGDDATTPQAAKAKVAMLMERLGSGTPFGELAMDYSEHPESAARGGDLGLVPLSAVKSAAPALRDAVLNTAPGNARVVTETGGAHTIIFVVAREPAGQRDLSTAGVRERITETLRAQKEQLLRTAYLTAARNDAEVVNYLARRLVATDGRSAEPATAPAS